MSLTDDWKVSNDFKSGKYFCRLNNIKKNKIVTIELSKFGHFNGVTGHYIEDVLAPCNYEEFQCLESKNKHLSDLLANQDKEVESLRDLLKECKESVQLHSDVTRGLEGRKSAAYQNLLNILTRINAAIGESEE